MLSSLRDYQHLTEFEFVQLAESATSQPEHLHITNGSTGRSCIVILSKRCGSCLIQIIAQESSVDVAYTDPSIAYSTMGNVLD